MNSYSNNVLHLYPHCCIQTLICTNLHSQNLVQPWVGLRFDTQTHTHWCNRNALNTFTRAKEYDFRRHVVMCYVLLLFTGVLLHHCYSNNGLNQSGWLNPTRAVVTSRSSPGYSPRAHTENDRLQEFLRSREHKSVRAHHDCKNRAIRRVIITRSDTPRVQTDDSSNTAVLRLIWGCNPPIMPPRFWRRFCNNSIKKLS